MKRLAALALLLPALALPAAAAPRDGDRFKDWRMRCEAQAATGAEACYLFQNLVLKKEQKRLLHVAVGYLGRDDTPVALFTLPLGVSLPGGVSLRVDDGKPLRFRYEHCDATGCVAPLALGDDLVKSLKAGRQARVAFFDATRREISVPVSLIGFTAGFDALR